MGKFLTLCLVSWGGVAAAAPAGTVAQIERLRCQLSRETEMVLGPALKVPLDNPNQNKKPLQGELVFNLFNNSAQLSDPARPGKLNLDMIRHDESLELTYRDVYYTENYEFYPKTGEVIYTEIYTFHYSEPQIFMGKGTCQAEYKGPATKLP